MYTPHPDILHLPSPSPLNRKFPQTTSSATSRIGLVLRGFAEGIVWLDTSRVGSTTSLPPHLSLYRDQIFFPYLRMQNSSIKQPQTIKLFRLLECLFHSSRPKSVKATMCRLYKKKLLLF